MTGTSSLLGAANGIAVQGVPRHCNVEGIAAELRRFAEMVADGTDPDCELGYKVLGRLHVFGAISDVLADAWDPLDQIIRELVCSSAENVRPREEVADDIRNIAARIAQ
ncbi:MAG: hypothetical protein U0136_11335 [Bdellovibrionota bacterium]